MKLVKGWVDLGRALVVVGWIEDQGVGKEMEGCWCWVREMSNEWE